MKEYKIDEKRLTLHEFSFTATYNIILVYVKTNKTKMTQSRSMSPFTSPASNQNAVMYLPLSSNSAGGNSNGCKEDVSGAKLNQLVRHSN